MMENKKHQTWIFPRNWEIMLMELAKIEVFQNVCISKRRNFNEALVKWACGWRFFRPLNLKLLLDLIIFLLGSVNLFWHSEPRGGGETCLLKIIIMENQKWVLITELWEKISQQAAGFHLGIQRLRNVWESGRTLSWLDWHPPTPVDVFEMHILPSFGNQSFENLFSWNAMS